MRSEIRQLLLPFQHPPDYDERDFMASGCNEQALAWLSSEWPDRRLALWGPGGSGKSHLLHMWAERAQARLLRGDRLRTLNELPDEGGVAIDDADAIRGEELFFHVLNVARDKGLRVLLSGQEPPSRWNVRLPDLSSRLRAITAVEISQPDDALLAALLMRLLSERQLVVAQSVQDWLLLRLPRSPAVLREAVARLDRASLRLGSGITRSLAAKVLADDGFIRQEPEAIPPARPHPSSPEGMLL